MQRQTEWTEVGHRLTIEVNAHGRVILSCHSRAMNPGGDAAPQRILWMLSQLGLSHGMPRSELGRVVTHWLAYYEDSELSELGISLFREVFDSFEERPEPSTRKDAPDSGTGTLH